jgi:CRP-like cAMP-binding protein
VRQRLELADKAQAAHRVEQVEKWASPRQAIQAMRLQAFTQFKNLDPDRLSLLAEKAQIYSAPMGTRLLNRGMSDPWNMYLLEGKVSLEPADGASLYIEGGSEKAANPVSFLKPRKYTVTAVTTVSFLWVHDAVLEAVLGTSATDTRSAPTLKQP